ncbi:HNH endonuclease [Aeromonas dhakensis]|uniref:HNH endonuclease n=1 Tax=Aeromonas dhakensis TaxID=196024 RepID=UPI003D21AC34
MGISEKDIKMLWGRAAGICCNPQCRIELTHIIEKDNYNVGEMAHVIAKKEHGPRGIDGGGENNYNNLILLCPTCHTHIDKSPVGTYTVKILHSWKHDTERLIRTLVNNIARNDAYKVFEVANNSLSYMNNIRYYTNCRLGFCEKTDARLYQMITRVQFHLDDLNISDEKREKINSICTKIHDKSDSGFIFFKEFERLAINLADQCYSAFVDPYDKAVFNFSRAYVDLFVSLVLNNFKQELRNDFERCYDKLFNKKDHELDNILNEMQSSNKNDFYTCFEPRIFKRVKYLLYNESRLL